MESLNRAALWGWSIDSELLRDPTRYLLKVNTPSQHAIFIPMTRGTYSESSFLDARTVPAEPFTYALPVGELLELYRRESPPPRKVCYIFHGAFCGSTLVARCLGGLSSCFVLKEPYAVHGLAEWKLANDPRFSTHLELVIALASRTFEPQETPIIKTTDMCVSIVGEVLSLHSSSRAVFMYASLEDFLAQVLKDSERRVWARMRAAWVAISRVFPWFHEPSTLSDVQCAVAVWLDAVYRHMNHCRRQPLHPVPSLEFRRYLVNPVGATLAILQHFKIDASLEAVATQVEEQSRTHAKASLTPYSMEVAMQHLDEGRVRFRAELSEGVAWARTMTGSDSLPTVCQAIAIDT